MSDLKRFRHFFVGGDLMSGKIVLDSSAVRRAIARITYEIIERNKGTENLCLVGIYSRGVLLAERISGKIEELEGVRIPVGCLDITEYRDDKKSGNDRRESSIPFDVNNKRLIIVDDVIFTGRTARAAMDAIIDRGRPSRIQLAVLIDRGHRELPIHADYVGKNLPTSRAETVSVMMLEADGADRVELCGNEC